MRGGIESGMEDAPVRLYTLHGCGHCERARRLLRRRGIPFAEVHGEATPDFALELLELTGRLSVPQITIRGEPVGGADDLARLDASGVLAARVAGLSFPRAVVRRRLSLRRAARWIASSLLGGRCVPWRYVVELVDANGRVLARHDAASEDEACTLAQALERRPPPPRARRAADRADPVRREARRADLAWPFMRSMRS